MSKLYCISESQLPALVAAAYELSRAQGLGFLHERAGALDQQTIDKIVGQETSFGTRLYMDYVHGRSVKLSVWAKDGRMYIAGDGWYDHSMAQLRELANRVGLELVDDDPIAADVSAPLRSSDDDAYAGTSMAAAVVDSFQAPETPTYEGGGGSFAGGGASGSWDSGSSSSGADFSNVSGGSDSTASFSGGD